MARTCGTCTLCCTLQGVREGLPDGEEKPPNVRCRHLKSQVSPCGGCGIYETRPKECSEYACLWLQGVGKNADRPDHIGVMFEIQQNGDPPKPYILGRTTARGKDLGQRAAALIKHMRAKGLTVVIANPEDIQGWRNAIVVERP